MYLAPVFPPIQGVGGSRYEEVAIKAAKVGADGELKGETEGLAQLSHKHIVSILGFTYCSPATGENERWLMILEFCHSDVERLLYGDEPAGVMSATDRANRTPRNVMLELALQIAQGLEYIHRANTQHLDLKPENVLLRNIGTEEWPEWEAKIADFGMDAEDSQAKSTVEFSTGSNSPRPGSQNTMWIGTFEYMSPEAAGQNREKFGTVGKAADVYSFGVMLWEMFFGMRVRKGFPDKEMNYIYPNGVKTEDLKTVARWMVHGERPEIAKDCPLPLQLLMKACWVEAQAKRVEFQLVVPVLETLCDAQRTGKLDDGVADEPEPEPQEQSYAGWLATLGLEDMQDSLSEYLSDPGKELVELAQMDEDALNEDIVEDDDLGFDADTKARFRAAVALLRTGGDPSTAAAEDGDACERLVEWVRSNPHVDVHQVRTVEAAYRSSSGQIRDLGGGTDSTVKELAQQLQAAQEEIAALRTATEWNEPVGEVTNF
eukprot:COSAG06_NODE_4236_length_4443_cov_2.395718_2_plen_488_part_00